MKRKIDPKTASIVLIVSGVLLILLGILRIVLIVMLANDGSGISIIGGADAPTAAYLFSRLGWRRLFSIILPVVFGILCIIVNVIDLIRRGNP